MAKNKIDSTSLFASMQKVATPKPIEPAIKEEDKPIPKKEVSKENVTVKEDETSIKKEDSTPTKKSESGVLSLNISIKEKKEAKSVHKNFLITKTMADKFSKLAEQYNKSENELFNDILESLFA